MSVLQTLRKLSMSIYSDVFATVLLPSEKVTSSSSMMGLGTTSDIQRSAPAEAR